MTLWTTVVLLSSGALTAWSDEVAKLEPQVKDALEAFKKADSTLAPIFQSAAGYVVFPRVAKGGFVVGAARGEGLVYEKGVLIGKATLTQGSIGAQIGGQVFRELILFETPATLAGFKRSNVEMSAQVSAVAAAEGLAKAARYVEGVMVFTTPIKGLMAEASIGGQKFDFEALP